jgi:hypothetical protein
LQGEFEGLQKKFGNLKSAAAKIGKITHEFFFIIMDLFLQSGCESRIAHKLLFLAKLKTATV